jgi:hypothetical protein
MKNEGYSLMSTENKLSREDYVKYRVKADHQQPLLYELSVLGLGFVPKYLKHWHSINKIIVEVEKYREFCKSLSAADVKKLAGKFDSSSWNIPIYVFLKQGLLRSRK